MGERTKREDLLCAFRDMLKMAKELGGAKEEIQSIAADLAIAQMERDLARRKAAEKPSPATKRKRKGVRHATKSAA